MAPLKGTKMLGHGVRLAQIAAIIVNLAVVYYGILAPLEMHAHPQTDMEMYLLAIPLSIIILGLGCGFLSFWEVLGWPVAEVRRRKWVQISSWAAVAMSPLALFAATFLDSSKSASLSLLHIFGFWLLPYVTAAVFNSWVQMEEP